MNSFLLTLLCLWTIASTANAATRKQWSGNVKMQIKRHADADSQCSDQALQTLNENVADFLQNEFLTLLKAENAFSLGVVRGTVNDDSLSLTASFDCLDCGTAPDKQSIARLLMFFAEHKRNMWLPEANATVTEGCVGQDTAVSSIMLFERVEQLSSSSSRLDVLLSQISS
jgi:hypothetical protein